MADQQLLTGGDGSTGQNGLVSRTIINENTTELFTRTSVDPDRAFTQTLIFDAKEVFYEPFVMTGSLTYMLGAGNLEGTFSTARQEIIADGINTINFTTEFDFITGINNGGILEAGTYEIYFLYKPNGKVSVVIPGTTQQSSGLIQLAPASNFDAVADGENDIDLTWDNVTNNSGYHIEYSYNGTSGWTTLSTPATDATSASHSGISAGTQVFYRMTTLGDGVSYSNSTYATASDTTAAIGDVTAPTFTFDPATGNAVWPHNKYLTITANEAMRKTDGTTLTDNTSGIIILKQTNSGGANISHTWTIDVTKTIITIAPTPSLGENQLVYLAINNVEDAAGNEVTVAQSITFTTTDYTFFNGVTNRVSFGNIMNTVLGGADKQWAFEIAMRNFSLSGSHRLMIKSDGAANNGQVALYYSGSDVYMIFYGSTNGQSRFIIWTNVLTAIDTLLRFEYNGAIDTADGLNRGTLYLNGVNQSAAKSLHFTQGALQDIPSTKTAYLAFGIALNSAGTPIESVYYSGEAKDFLLETGAGTDQIDVPNLRTGTDVSGNANHGTWA